MYERAPRLGPSDSQSGGEPGTYIGVIPAAAADAKPVEKQLVAVLVHDPAVLDGQPAAGDAGAEFIRRHPRRFAVLLASLFMLALPTGIDQPLTVGADGGLLVVRAGKTRYSTVDKLLDHMPKERLLGVVLNRIEEQPESSSYYYQHRYYNREKRTTEMPPVPPSGRVEEEVATVN